MVSPSLPLHPRHILTNDTDLRSTLRKIPALTSRILALYTPIVRHDLRENTAALVLAHPPILVLASFDQLPPRPHFIQFPLAFFRTYRRSIIDLLPYASFPNVDISVGRTAARLFIRLASPISLHAFLDIYLPFPSISRFLQTFRDVIFLDLSRALLAALHCAPSSSSDPSWKDRYRHLDTVSIRTSFVSPSHTLSNLPSTPRRLRRSSGSSASFPVPYDGNTFSWEEMLRLAPGCICIQYISEITETNSSCFPPPPSCAAAHPYSTFDSLALTIRFHRIPRIFSSVSGSHFVSIVRVVVLPSPPYLRLRPRNVKLECHL
ncbi:hypothetical protein B0H13DRAFT_2328774 [Mycena leptocephala]|nr:hypothetical protein B0H13DRAFT_2328774 [Mycena leptocephala]